MMNKLLETLKRKWPEYLLEIIVLIIGIYGAFTLDNWNETRKNKETERIILQNLKRELLDNKAELEITIKSHEYSRKCIFELLQLFGKDISMISTKKLDTLLAQAETVWTFEAKNGYIQSIISSGNINYLKNDSLKSMLTSFNSEVTDATQEVDYISELLQNRLWPNIEGTVNFSDRQIAYGYQGFPAQSYISDYQAFFQNQVIDDILSNIAGWHINIENEETQLSAYFDLLIQLLNQEIAKNK